MFDIGFDIKVDSNQMVFKAGKGVFQPEMEKRSLDSISKSLLNPHCNGPDIVYSIAMDIGKEKDKKHLIDNNLLFGAVIYAKGQLGDEPIRSQGHIHSISKSCNSSTPEVYEIWEGEGIIYMQESGDDNPGRCFAVRGKVGDVIVVPPGWAHATISADRDKALVFGAWCVRDFGFDYAQVRAHNGLAFYPLIDEDGKITWKKNDTYDYCELVEKKPREYKELNIEKNISIYKQYEKDKERFFFVKDPKIKEKEWINFIP